MKTISHISTAGLLALMLIHGCAVYEPTPLGPEGLSQPAREWTWEHPLPQGQSLTDVWGTHPRRVWAVGSGGTALQFDGASWIRRDLPTQESLLGIWGSDDDDIFVVGTGGLILHFDGSVWTRQESGTTASLSGVWGSGPDDVYAVGQSGTVLHYDGTRWEPRSFNPSLHMISVWGRGPSEVYVVAFPGRIYRFDGTAWDLVNPDTPLATARRVWGPPEGDLLAFGYSRTVQRFDGTSWSPWLTIPANHGPVTVHDLWGTSLDDLHMVGDSGLVAHYNGEGLKLEEPTSVRFSQLLAVAGFDDGRVFAVGEQGTLLERRGGLWRRHSRSAFDDLCPAPGEPVGDCDLPNLLDAVTTVGGDAYGLYPGGLLRRTASGEWTRVLLPTTGPFTAIWAAPDGEVFAAGDGIVVRGRDTTWEARNAPITVLPHGLRGTATDNLYALGEEELVRFDSVQWHQVELPRDVKPRSIWVTPEGIHLLGGRNAFWWFDGREWTNLRPNLGTIPILSQLWGLPEGPIYAIGENGNVSSFDGERWESRFTVGPFFLRDIWGTSEEDLYLLGLGDEILRFDGSTWLLSTTKLAEVTFTAIVGTPGVEREVLAIGSAGSILRRRFPPLR